MALSQGVRTFTSSAAASLSSSRTARAALPAPLRRSLSPLLASPCAPRRRTPHPLAARASASSSEAAVRAFYAAVNEKDFLDAITKVIKGHKKFSATARYMVYN